MIDFLHYPSLEEKANEVAKSRQETVESIDDNDGDSNQAYDDAEVSILENLPSNENLVDDFLTDLLSKKLSACTLNGSSSDLDANENHIPLMNITNNVFGDISSKNKTAASDESKFLRPQNKQFLATSTLPKKQQKIFMYGDAPSKLDRAVYLAIQDAKPEEIGMFSLLNEWLDYMRYCNPQEMQQWKTPKKPAMISRIQRN